MDSSAKNVFRLEKMSEDRLNNNDPEFPSHWNNSTNLGFYQNTMSSSINLPVPLPSMDWNPSQSMPKGFVFFPAFIDPAFSGIVNPFGGTSEPSNSYGNASKSTAGAQFRNHGLNTQQAFEDASAPIDHGFRKRESTFVEGGEAPDSADGSVDSSNRKKRIQQDMESDQVQENLRPATTETVSENDLNKQKLDPNNSTRTNMKSDGKKSKDGSNSPKEDYIHMRARRGQATNNHSLAERVRREKISERMKYLQELVPGCSKVTGKAVMLDEIINYVQSLQRQVEFLSMKLAAVNPRLDFNIKDSRGGPPTIGFSPDIPSQRGLVQAGISGLMNPPDAFRGAIHGQMNIVNGYKDTRPQAPNPWENQIHNFVQPSLNVNPFMNTHEFVKSGHVFPL